MLQRISELIEQKQYATLRQEFAELNAADIATVFEDVSSGEVVKIFRILPKDMAAEIFSYLPLEDQQEIINKLTAHEAATIIDNLYADDAVDLLEEMPATVVKRILAQADPETRRDINQLLQYPESSAGSVMTVEFIDVKENWTVRDAINAIRREGTDSESIDVLYVLSPSRHLMGTVSLRRLLLSDPDEKLGNIMHENIITITTLTDQEEVARIFQKYDFNTMPVVDSEDRLVGIITVDDVVDIMEQEATADIEMMAAITPDDKPYMKTGVFSLLKARIPWLLILMLSSAFTGKIIQYFEGALASYVILTSFIPMFMGTGGNAGGQASVTIIRSLSLDEVEFKDIFRVMWKEFRVGFLAAVILCAANFVKVLLVDHVTLAVAAVVSLTLFITVVLSKLVGCVLPMLAKKIGLDPAVMASPFIQTIVDAGSLLIYFNVASIILGI